LRILVGGHVRPGAAHDKIILRDKIMTMRPAADDRWSDDNG